MPALQEAANRAIEHGLRRLDKRHGWRKPTRNVIAERHTIDGFKDERWNRPIAVGDVVPAVVVDGAEDRRRRAPAHRPLPRRPDAARASPGRGGRRRRISSSRAISSKSRSRKLDEATGAATVTLEQTPLVEGALVAIDNRTGQIKAMVGGWSFNRSKFNRAVQAYRQLGSTFKPIVYTAAIDRGFTPASIIDRRAGQLPGRQRPDLQPAELRPQVRRADHAAPRARGVAQHPGDQDDGRRSGRRTCSSYAKRFGFERGLPALSADRARRRRRDAARGDQRLHRRSRTRACA